MSKVTNVLVNEEELDRTILISHPMSGLACIITVDPEPKECVWVKLGMVSYRLCTRNYDCLAVEPKECVWVKSGLSPIISSYVITPKKSKKQECVWMKLGMVSYRLCTRNYNCLTCEFDQMMQEKMAGEGALELDSALEKFKELPGNQRLCRYAIKGYVSYRLCTRLFQCSTCEFAQMMEDALQQKLAKLAKRREALDIDHWLENRNKRAKGGEKPSDNERAKVREETNRAS